MCGFASPLRAGLVLNGFKVASWSPYPGTTYSGTVDGVMSVISSEGPLEAFCACGRFHIWIIWFWQIRFWQHRVPTFFDQCFLSPEQTGDLTDLSLT